MTAMFRIVIVLLFLGFGPVQRSVESNGWRLFYFPRNHLTDAGSGLAKERFSASQGPVQFAVPGDIATGRVLREEDKELDLDTSPCAGNRVVRFHDPYEKSVVGKLNCGDKMYDRVQVRQK
jgi:hypothetical protein